MFSYEDVLAEVLIDEKTLQKRIEELGAEISKDYKDRDLVLICFLRGGVVFLVDLMRKISGRTYAELAQVVYEQIQKGNVIKLDFQWVQSTDFISVLTDCTDIGIGDYYLAWKGVSDNTHPKIKTIKVLGE